jgi:hypothetical protein
MNIKWLLMWSHLLHEAIFLDLGLERNNVERFSRIGLHENCISQQYTTNSRRIIEQFTVRGPENEIPKLDSIQGIQDINLRDEGSPNDQGYEVAAALMDSMQRKSLVEDGNVENPTRMNSEKAY